MLFGTGKRRYNKTLNITSRNQKVTETTSYKYLGVILDQNLSMTENFSKILGKASQRANLLIKLRTHTSPEIARRIYVAMILPIYLYINCYALFHQYTANST